jgi:hypothetical protein
VAQPTARSSQAATGAGQASTFQAATSSGGSIIDSLNAGKEVLGKIDAGEAGDKLKKLLDVQIPSSQELEQILDLYGKVAGQCDEEQLAKLNKAVGLQMMGRSIYEQFKQLAEKFSKNPNGKVQIEW